MRSMLLVATVLAVGTASVAARAADEPTRWSVSLGPWYGHNLKETDSGSSTKSSNLLGPELRVEYALGPSWSVYGDLVAFNTGSSAESNGSGGRAAIGLNHQWNLGAWHPYVGPKVGYIGGSGVEDGTIVGPEAGVKVNLTDTMFVHAQIAYDHDTRNSFDDGIVNGGIGFGARF